MYLLLFSHTSIRQRTLNLTSYLLVDTSRSHSLRQASYLWMPRTVRYCPVPPAPPNHSKKRVWHHWSQDAWDFKCCRYISQSFLIIEIIIIVSGWRKNIQRWYWWEAISKNTLTFNTLMIAIGKRRETHWIISRIQSAYQPYSRIDWSYLMDCDLGSLHLSVEICRSCSQSSAHYG